VKLATLIGRGILVISFLIVGVSTSFAQRSFIEKESSGWGLEIGYSANDQTKGAAAAVGFTSDESFDFGFGFGLFSTRRSVDIYSFQFNADYYFIRAYGHGPRLMFSLRTNLIYDLYRSGGYRSSLAGSHSGLIVGPRLSLGSIGKNMQFEIGGMTGYLDYANIEEISNVVVAFDLTVLFKTNNKGWLGPTVGFSHNSELNTFSLGVLIITEKLNKY
jgi:hypothetical protein